MRLAFILVVCTAILLIGRSEVVRERTVSKALSEVIKFINLYDTQLNYIKPDYEELCVQGKNIGFRYIVFEGNEIRLSTELNADLRALFSEFTSRIGTTDAYGQNLLCKEYIDRFGEMLSERKSIEKNKIKVNAAVSILGAAGVFIAFV